MVRGRPCLAAHMLAVSVSLTNQQNPSRSKTFRLTRLSLSRLKVFQPAPVYKNSSCEILLHDIFICCGLQSSDTTSLLSNSPPACRERLNSDLFAEVSCWLSSGNNISVSPFVFRRHHQRTAVICQPEIMTDWRLGWSTAREGRRENTQVSM